MSQLHYPLQAALALDPPTDDSRPEPIPENVPSPVVRECAAPSGRISALNAALARAKADAGGWVLALEILAAAADMVVEEIGDGTPSNRSSVDWSGLRQVAWAAWLTLLEEHEHTIDDATSKLAESEFLLIAEISIDELMLDEGDEFSLRAAGVFLVHSLKRMSAWAAVPVACVSSTRKAWILLNSSRLLDALSFAAPVIDGLNSVVGSGRSITLPHLRHKILRAIDSSALETIRSEARGKAKLRSLFQAHHENWATEVASFLQGASVYAELCDGGRDLLKEFIRRCGDGDPGDLDEAVFRDSVKHVFSLPSFPAQIIEFLSTLDLGCFKPAFAECISEAVSLRMRSILNTDDEPTCRSLESFCSSLGRVRGHGESCFSPIFTEGVRLIAGGDALTSSGFKALLRILCSTWSEAAVERLYVSHAELSVVVHGLLRFYDGEAGRGGRLHSILLLVLLLGKVEELFERADCAEALFLCVQELGGLWVEAPLRATQVSRFLQRRIDDYRSGAAGGSARFLSLRKLNSRQRDQFTRATALVYSDLYGIPLYRYRNDSPLMDTVPIEQLSALHSFVQFLSQDTDCAVSELRESYKAIFKLAPVADPPLQPAGALIDAYLFDDGLESESLAEFMTTYDPNTPENHPSLDFYQNFYHDYSLVYPSPISGLMNYKDCRETVKGMESTSLPLIRLLLLDLMFNPLRLASWTSLYDCLRDVQEQAADKVAEFSLSDSFDIDKSPRRLRGTLELLSPDSDGCDAEADYFQSIVLSSRCPYVRKETSFLVKLLQIREYCTALCVRLHRVFVKLFERLRSQGRLTQEDAGSGFALMESHAFLMYTLAATRPKGSRQRNMHLREALSWYTIHISNNSSRADCNLLAFML